MHIITVSGIVFIAMFNLDPSALVSPTSVHLIR